MKKLPTLIIHYWSCFDKKKQCFLFLIIIQVFFGLILILFVIGWKRLNLDINITFEPSNHVFNGFNLPLFSDLHEGSILYNIKKRYKRSTIYVCKLKTSLLLNAQFDV